MLTVFPLLAAMEYSTAGRPGASKEPLVKSLRQASAHWEHWFHSSISSILPFERCPRCSSTQRGLILTY
ncbi:unnamed protein product, partial [Nesidiocoris tenuis]